MSNTQSLAKSYCVLLVGEAIARLLTLVAFGYLARTLGPGGFGVIEFCFAHALILSFMVDFGASILGTREMAQHPDEVRQVTQRIVAIRLWSMGTSICLLVGYTMLSPQPWVVKSLLLLFGVSLVPTPYLLQWVFLSRNWMRYVSIAQIVRYGVFAGGVLLTVRGAPDMWKVAAAEIAGVFAAAIFTVVSFRLKIGFWPPALPAWPTWNAIKQAVPIALSQFMWAAKYVFVTVAVGFVVGLGENADQVGHLGAAVRIIVAMHVFVSIYFNNLVPPVSRAVTESVDPLRSLLGRAIRASVWISLCGSMLVVVMARYVMQFVYGQAYGQSVILLQILVWMLAAALVSAHFRATLIATSRQGLELLSTATGAVVALTLMVALYRHFGLAGVAVAMVTGEISTLVISLVLVHRCVLPMRLDRRIWAPIVAAIAIAVLLVAWASMATWAKASIVVGLFALAAAVFDREFLGIFRQLVPAALRAAAGPAPCDETS